MGNERRKTRKARVLAKKPKKKWMDVCTNCHEERERERSVELCVVVKLEGKDN